MELLKDLELVAVEYESQGQKAVLTYLDREHGEIRTVNFNRQAYKDGKYVDDEEKAKKVDEWCEELFGLAFKDLSKAIGTRKDVYAYDNFNSLFEVKQIAKFTEDMEGMMIQSEVSAVIVDDTAIHIQFEYEGETYESKMSYAKYMEFDKKFYVDPIKKEKQFKKFEEKFGVPVEKADKIVGHPCIVEVKKAMGKYLYADMKKFATPKK